MAYTTRPVCRMTCALTCTLGLLACGKNEPRPSSSSKSLDRARLKHAPKLVLSRMQIRGTPERIVAIARVVGASIPDSPAPSYLLVELHDIEAPKRPGMGKHVSVIYVEYPEGLPASVRTLATATFDNRVAVFEHGKAKRPEHQAVLGLAPLPPVGNGELHVHLPAHSDMRFPPSGPAELRLHVRCSVEEAREQLNRALNAFYHDERSWTTREDGTDIVFMIANWQEKLARSMEPPTFAIYFLWIAGYPIFI